MSQNSIHKSTSGVSDETTTIQQNTPIIYSNEKTQSNSIAELARCLANAQNKMGKATKASDNPFFKSKYADLTSCLDAVLPALNEEGIALVQGSEYDPGTKTFFVTTTLLHLSGEWIKSKVYVPLNKLDAHGVGAAFTYGRRFMVAAMCSLGQEDDDGNSISKLEKKQAGVPRMAHNASPKIQRPATTKNPQPAVSAKKPVAAKVRV